MFKKRRKIFLSYCHSNQVEADVIASAFENYDVDLLIDRRDIGYAKSIKEFMHRIGKSDFVIVIISDQYLKSPNCMYEVEELINSHEFEERILPVLLPNADIFTGESQQVYYDFWKSKYQEAIKLLSEHENSHTFHNKLKYKKIHENIGEFFIKIQDINTFTYDNLLKKKFRPLFDKAQIRIRVTPLTFAIYALTILLLVITFVFRYQGHMVPNGNDVLKKTITIDKSDDSFKQMNPQQSNSNSLPISLPKAQKGNDVTNKTNFRIDTFYAQPNSVDLGDSCKIYWSVIGGKSISITGGQIAGNYPASGSRFTGPIFSSTTFLLTTSNGIVGKSSKLNIKINPPQIVSFDALRRMINYGESTKIYWRVKNIAHVSLDYNEKSFQVKACDTIDTPPLQKTTRFEIATIINGKRSSAILIVNVRKPLQGSKKS